MALIAVAVYDTVENNRTSLTDKTLKSLLERVNFHKHRIVVIDNASCQATKDVLEKYKFVNGHPFIEVITNDENIGTAKAINLAWRTRKPKENLIKMDNDVVVHQSNWVDLLEEAIERCPEIGIIGLKRKDLWESPNRTDGYRSKLIMLENDSKNPQKWIVIEEVKHVMGTCQMYNHKLIDEIGGLYQMEGIYGFDDSLASVRCSMAGFKNVFLPSVEIDHIDPGADDYTEWKKKYASKYMELFNATKQKYIDGELDIFHPL